MNKLDSTICVTKLESTRRLLEAAVDLYFRRGDWLAIHLLASAAHDVLTNLLNQSISNKKEPRNPAIIELINKYGPEVNHGIRQPQGFLKHADHIKENDPHAVIEFDVRLTECLLAWACAECVEMMGVSIPALDLYVKWFGAEEMSRHDQGSLSEFADQVAEMRRNDDREGFFRAIMRMDVSQPPTPLPAQP